MHTQGTLKTHFIACTYVLVIDNEPKSAGSALPSASN